MPNQILVQTNEIVKICHFCKPEKLFCCILNTAPCAYVFRNRILCETLKGVRFSILLYYTLLLGLSIYMVLFYIYDLYVVVLLLPFKTGSNSVARKNHRSLLAYLIVYTFRGKANLCQYRRTKREHPTDSIQ